MDLSMHPEWMDEGICAQTDPDLFFPIAGDAATAVTAKSVCSRCPVRAVCLEWALAQGMDGIWGGTTSTQRGRIRASRAREAAA